MVAGTPAPHGASWFSRPSSAPNRTDDQQHCAGRDRHEAARARRLEVACIGQCCRSAGDDSVHMRAVAAAEIVSVSTAAGTRTTQLVVVVLSVGTEALQVGNHCAGTICIREERSPGSTPESITATEHLSRPVPHRRRRGVAGSAPASWCCWSRACTRSVCCLRDRSHRLRAHARGSVCECRSATATPILSDVVTSRIPLALPLRRAARRSCRAPIPSCAQAQTTRAVRRGRAGCAQAGAACSLAADDGCGTRLPPMSTAANVDRVVRRRD